MSNDFRPQDHIYMGATPDLTTRLEAGDFIRAKVPNPEKGQTQVQELGHVIVIDRVTIVNDDLGILMRNAANNGIAALRTQENLCYNLLKENSGLGPTLGSNSLFHSTRSNINATGTGITAAGFTADRVVMAKQKTVGDIDFAGLRADTLVVPIELEPPSRVLRDNEKEYGTADQPNPERGMFKTIVGTPRLTGTRRYWFDMGAYTGMVASPICRSYYGSMAPYLVMAESFTTRGGVWLAALDFGVNAVNYRGAVTNAGA